MNSFSRVNGLVQWVEEQTEGNISDCLDSLMLAERLAQENENYKLKVNVLLSLSRFSFSRLNDLEKSNLYLERIREIADSLDKDPWVLSQYHNGRGVLFFNEQTNLKRALNEFRKANYYCVKYHLPKDPVLLNNYALVFLSSGQSRRALKLFNEAARIAKVSKNELGSRFIISNALNIGVCHIYLNDAETAERQFKSVVAYARKTPGTNDDFDALVYLGVFQEEQGLMSEALQTLKEAEKLIKMSYSFQTKALLCESMELIYKAMGHMGQAYSYTKKGTAFLDSLRKVKLSEQAFAMDYKFEAQKLKDEKIISDLKSRSERQNFKWRIFLLFAILLIVVLTGIFIIYRLNKIKELNRIKAENASLEKERIRQQAEIDILRKEEALISANVELNVRKNELSDLKGRLQSHLEKSHDPEFDDLKTFLKQAQKTEKRAEQMKYLDHVLSYSKSTFYANLRTAHPGLTDDELRLATFMRFNLSSEELAEVFNISMSSLMTKRYRLRKKLGIAKDQSLEQYILQF